MVTQRAGAVSKIFVDPLTDLVYRVIIIPTAPSGLCDNTCTLEGVLFLWRFYMAEKEFKTIDEQIELLVTL